MSSRDNSPSDLVKLEPVSKEQRSAFHREVYVLTIKVVITIAGTWASLDLFQLFFAPLIGVTHLHIQIAGIMATVIISFLVITAIRRILKKFTVRNHPQFSASLSFFAVIVISLISGLSVLHQLDVDPQEILISGGVTAIIIGIGVSTIVGNILSSGLILTTYPAKIGDSIHVVNDDVHGKIQEINLMYTTIETDEGKEYIVPNNAIIQGNIRLLKDVSFSEQIPYAEGDIVEITSAKENYVGTVIRITPKFTTILNDERTKEFIIANSTILQGNFTIVKHRTKS